jgi:hypothetical protein
MSTAQQTNKLPLKMEIEVARGALAGLRGVLVGLRGDGCLVQSSRLPRGVVLLISRLAIRPQSVLLGPVVVE